MKENQANVIVAHALNKLVFIKFWFIVSRHLFINENWLLKKRPTNEVKS